MHMLECSIWNIQRIAQQTQNINTTPLTTHIGNQSSTITSILAHQGPYCRIVIRCVQLINNKFKMTSIKTLNKHRYASQGSQQNRLQQIYAKIAISIKQTPSKYPQLIQAYKERKIAAARIQHNIYDIAPRQDSKSVRNRNVLSATQRGTVQHAINSIKWYSTEGRSATIYQRGQYNTQPPKRTIRCQSATIIRGIHFRQSMKGILNQPNRQKTYKQHHPINTAIQHKLKVDNQYSNRGSTYHQRVIQEGKKKKNTKSPMPKLIIFHQGIILQSKH